MPPEWLDTDEVNVIKKAIELLGDNGYSGLRHNLEMIIVRHSEPKLCGSRFPFAGFQADCDRPAGHEMGTHRWTRPSDQWQVFWDVWR